MPRSDHSARVLPSAACGSRLSRRAETIANSEATKNPLPSRRATRTSNATPSLIRVHRLGLVPQDGGAHLLGPVRAQ